jgi:hypothetical protein
MTVGLSNRGPAQARRNLCSTISEAIDSIGVSSVKARALMSASASETEQLI